MCAGFHNQFNRAFFINIDQVGVAIMVAKNCEILWIISNLRLTSASKK